MRFDKRMIRLAAVLAVSAFGLTASPSSAGEFRGGGALFGFSGCQAQGWSGAQPLRVRFVPAANDSERHSLALFLANGGALSFQFAGPARRTSVWRQTWGSAIYTGPGDMNNPRPQVRVTQFSITAPNRANLSRATDIRMRLQIRRFNWLSTCRVNLALAMRSAE